MQRSVLLVDDELGMEELVRDRLELAGLDVCCAAADDLDEGLSRAADMRPDLVVLDHHFVGDERTGSDVIVQFRDAGARMVLIFTADVDVHESNAPVGADAVLDKMSLALLPATIGLLLADSVTTDLRAG